MSEIIKSQEYETKLRHNLGLMLVKPDAIEAGIAEELIDHAHRKLKDGVPDIELLGAAIVPSFNDADVDKIYPDLHGEFKQALKSFYKQGPSIAVFWSSKSGTQDIWAQLIKIRGKITVGYGLDDSIRSIIPLPGHKERYEETTNKLQSGNLDFDDYIELCKSLVHVPQNMKEFTGLFLSINEEDINDILHEDKFKNLRKELMSQIQLELP